MFQVFTKSAHRPERCSIKKPEENMNVASSTDMCPKVSFIDTLSKTSEDGPALHNNAFKLSLLLHSPLVSVLLNVFTMMVYNITKKGTSIF